MFSVQVVRRQWSERAFGNDTSLDIAAEALLVNQSAFLDAETKADTVSVRVAMCAGSFVYVCSRMLFCAQAATKGNAGGKGRQQTPGVPSAKGGVTCNYCGMSGHKVDQCFAKKRAQAGGDDSQPKRQKGFVLLRVRPCVCAPMALCLACRHGKQGSQMTKLKNLLEQQKPGKGAAPVVIG